MNWYNNCTWGQLQFFQAIIPTFVRTYILAIVKSVVMYYLFSDLYYIICVYFIQTRVIMISSTGDLSPFSACVCNVIMWERVLLLQASIVKLIACWIRNDITISASSVSLTQSYRILYIMHLRLLIILSSSAPENFRFRNLQVA